MALNIYSTGENIADGVQAIKNDASGLIILPLGEG